MFLLLLAACAASTRAPADSPAPTVLADVQEVGASGEAEAFTLAVTVLSPDVDCSRYANWWEVLTPEGELVYRRILWHSHPDEQPVTRTGGPVPIAGDELVVVRAHLHPDGYGGQALSGSVDGGFSVVELASDFAAGVEDEGEQATECWY